MSKINRTADYIKPMRRKLSKMIDAPWSVVPCNGTPTNAEAELGR